MQIAHAVPIESTFQRCDSVLPAGSKSLTTPGCVQPINQSPLTNAQHCDSPGGNLHFVAVGVSPHILPAYFARLAKFDCYLPELLLGKVSGMTSIGSNTL